MTGLITLRIGGRVCMKIVSLDLGGDPPALVQTFGYLDAGITLEEAYGIALREQFGHQDSLFVLSDMGTFLPRDAEFPPTWWRGFKQPHVHPAARNGAADYWEIVDLD